MIQTIEIEKSKVIITLNIKLITLAQEANTAGMEYETLVKNKSRRDCTLQPATLSTSLPRAE